ncbi:carbohydrate ABC transporter permease [Microbacterium sp. 18062]|uniref:carbohydrate ABC transporter permease n=1 Tax=Microbacterium sp. 18062 TaxID=2681410 RepID=UPI00135B6CB9|nr:carbohydrate ABC transporter permease [Microbacterium sp. 18062]
MSPTAVRISRAARRAPVHLTLILVTTLWVVPLVGVIVYAFRTPNDAVTSGWWTIITDPLFTVRNFADAITTGGIGRALINSLLITVPTTILTVLLSAIAAYALARMRFRGRVVVLVSAVALLVVPPQLTLVPVLRLFRELGLVGSIPSVWFYQVGFVIPFGVFLLYGFFRAFPGEILEAAALDGAGPVRAFFRIVVPTSVPALAALAIMQFMWSWNDLLIPLLFLGSASDAPVTVTVAGMIQSTGGGLSMVTAGAILAMIVPVVVTLVLQRFFIRGILGGAVRG